MPILNTFSGDFCSTDGRSGCGLKPHGTAWGFNPQRLFRKVARLLCLCFFLLKMNLHQMLESRQSEQSRLSRERCLLGTWSLLASQGHSERSTSAVSGFSISRSAVASLCRSASDGGVHCRSKSRAPFWRQCVDVNPECHCATLERSGESWLAVTQTPEPVKE